jgi:hypothetical protein
MRNLKIWLRQLLRIQYVNVFWNKNQNGSDVPIIYIYCLWSLVLTKIHTLACLSSPDTSRGKTNTTPNWPLTPSPFTLKSLNHDWIIDPGSHFAMFLQSFGVTRGLHFGQDVLVTVAITATPDSGSGPVRVCCGYAWVTTVIGVSLRPWASPAPRCVCRHEKRPPLNTLLPGNIKYLILIITIIIKLD